MADLGELREYITPETLKFTVDGNQYTVCPTAAQAIRFYADYAATEKFTDTNMLQMGARLLGGDYDDTHGFTETGVIGELLANGTDLSAIIRICYTTILWVRFGDEPARTYYATGDMGKALGTNQPSEPTDPDEQMG